MFLLRAPCVLTVNACIRDDTYGLGGLYQTAVTSVAIAQRLASSICTDSFWVEAAGG